MIWDIPSEKNTSQSVLWCGAYEPISQLRSALGQMGPFGPPLGTEMAQRRPTWLGPSVNLIYCGSIWDQNQKIGCFWWEYKQYVIDNVP